MRNFLPLAMLYILSGCAVSQVVIKGNEAPWAGSAKITPISIATKAIHIVEVTDARDKREIGIARTGVQYTETPVLMNEELSSYLNKYFTKAFYLRNLQVDPDASVKLYITVNQLWLTEVLKNNEAAKCEAHFSFRGSERTIAQDREWKGNYQTTYQSIGDLGDGTEKLGPTLATCLNQVVEELVKDPSFQNFIKQ